MKRKTVSGVIVAMSVAAVIVPRAHAAVEKFDYPELMVTPRASDRVEMEAQKEDSRRWSSQLPTLVPAAAVFAAGVVQLGHTNPVDDPNKGGALAGMVAGGGWLAYSIISALTENAYSVAAQELKAMPKGTVREQLTRERMAEEALRRRARQARLTRYLATVTLVGASAFMYTTAQESNKVYTDANGVVTTGNGTSRSLDLGAAVISLAPLFFPSHFEEIHKQQEAYKKRIFAPVASSALLPVASTGGYVPGMLLTWKF